jgi:hypothetical protein
VRLSGAKRTLRRRAETRAFIRLDEEGEKTAVVADDNVAQRSGADSSALDGCPRSAVSANVRER